MLDMSKSLEKTSTYFINLSLNSLIKLDRRII
jgi:hypothetical protein